MEEKLAAGLGEREIAKFVENDEVLASQTIGDPPLSSATGLGLEPVDEIDDVEEAPSGAAGPRTATT